MDVHEVEAEQLLGVHHGGRAGGATPGSGRVHSVADSRRCRSASGANVVNAQTINGHPMSPVDTTTAAQIRLEPNTQAITPTG